MPWQGAAMGIFNGLTPCDVRVVIVNPCKVAVVIPPANHNIFRCIADKVTSSTAMQAWQHTPWPHNMAHNAHGNSSTKPVSR